jgi:hypothetical protein
MMMLKWSEVRLEGIEEIWVKWVIFIQKGNLNWIEEMSKVGFSERMEKAIGRPLKGGSQGRVTSNWEYFESWGRREIEKVLSEWKVPSWTRITVYLPKTLSLTFGETSDICPLVNPCICLWWMLWIPWIQLSLRGAVLKVNQVRYPMSQTDDYCEQKNHTSQTKTDQKQRYSPSLVGSDSESITAKEATHQLWKK